VIPFQGNIRVFVGLERVDMRKSFDGLSREVERQICLSPLAGHLYVFLGRNPRRAKMLLFDRHGYWIFYRRLERGTFELPTGRPGETRMEIDAASLAAILDGIDLRSIRRRVRYHRPSVPTGEGWRSRIGSDDLVDGGVGA
jgi:transposase